MKTIFFTLFAIVAVASAGIVNFSPFTYSYSPLGYSAGIYSSPVSSFYPAIQSGYVAATRGSIHTAPLPEGPFAFSHHINTAPAAGTF